MLISSYKQCFINAQIMILVLLLKVCNAVSLSLLHLVNCKSRRLPQTQKGT